MDSSSSASSSSISHYRGAPSFPVSNGGSRPRWPDLTIYESTPHYPPPMDSFNGRLVPNSSNYGYDYTNYSIGGRSTSEAVTEKVEEDEGDGAAAVEREHMFDKVVTPSDVGKLNRLVIPKQHAEKYFPLDSNSGDSKGLLLNFEDRKGKSWRFRYSYWNSSQSYVMTKGWSRFVKEKKLDAGDVVSFYRGVAEKKHFYIDWRRRRPDAPPSIHHHYPLYRGYHPHHGFSLHRPIHPPYFLAPPIPTPNLHHQARELHHQRGSVVSYNGVTTNNSSTGCYGGNYGTLSPNFRHPSGSVIYLGSAAPPPHQQTPVQALGIGSSQRDLAMVFDSVPVVVHGAEKASSKRLRLFGVNMDCTDADNEPNRHQNHHDLLLDSDQVSSSSGESGLQLSLQSGVSAVDKGKSSMSLDLDI